MERGRRDLFPNHVHKLAERPSAIDEWYTVATATSYIFVYGKWAPRLLKSFQKGVFLIVSNNLVHWTLAYHMNYIQNTDVTQFFDYIVGGTAARKCTGHE
jgi:hypothetical protein